MVACIVRTIAAVLFLLGVKPSASGFVAGVCGLLALSQNPFGFIFTIHTLFLGTIAAQPDVMGWVIGALPLSALPPTAVYLERT